MTDNKVTALVLAGVRPGGDPLASAYDVPHKAAVPVAGRPMGEWVVDALRDVPYVGRILVAADWRTLGPAVPLLARHRVVPVAAMPTIADSVEAVLNAVPPPILITTVDHPLLTPAMIGEFLDKVPADADAAIAVARREVVQAAFPRARRAYVRFRGARVTGCNLFLLASSRARAAVRFWSKVDDSSDPAAMVGALGMGSLMLWWAGMLSIDGAAQRLSHQVGARLAVVEMSQAEAAIDVDQPEDLRLADAVLSQRGAYWASG
ncbi:MAG: NTP transferase domain-containing protein [Solirubrobacterales bacterium]